MNASTTRLTEARGKPLTRHNRNCGRRVRQPFLPLLGLLLISLGWLVQADLIAPPDPGGGSSCATCPPADCWFSGDHAATNRVKYGYAQFTTSTNSPELKRYLTNSMGKTLTGCLFARLNTTYITRIDEDSGESFLVSEIGSGSWISGGNTNTDMKPPGGTNYGTGVTTHGAHMAFPATQNTNTFTETVLSISNSSTNAADPFAANTGMTLSKENTTETVVNKCFTNVMGMAYQLNTNAVKEFI